MNEFDPTQNTLELTPQPQPEQSFLKRVISSVERPAAIGFSVLALAGVVEAGPAVASTTPDFPPITEKIDGLPEEKWHNQVDAEARFAASCKNDGPHLAAKATSIAKTSSRTIFKMHYEAESMQSCNGYGRLFRKLRIYTKDSGQKKYVRGPLYPINDHRALNKTGNFRIGQRCKDGHTLKAQLRESIVWKHLDGTTSSGPYRSAVYSVKCP